MEFPNQFLEIEFTNFDKYFDDSTQASFYLSKIDYGPIARNIAQFKFKNPNLFY